MDRETSASPVDAALAWLEAKYDELTVEEQRELEARLLEASWFMKQHKLWLLQQGFLWKMEEMTWERRHRNRSRKPYAERNAAIVAEHQAGRSAGEIARKLGITEHAVNGVLKRHRKGDGGGRN